MNQSSTGRLPGESKGQRRQHVLMVGVFAVILVCLVVATFSLPSRGVSTLENRTLAQRPSLPEGMTGLKAYLRGWDAYLLDQMPLRDTWVRTYSFIQTHLLAKTTLNDVVVGKDGYLMSVYDQTAGPLSAQRIQRDVEPVVKLAQQVSAYGGHFLFVGVPDKESYYRQFYPAYVIYPERRDLAEHDFFAALAERQVPALDLRPVLEAHADEQLYFKTDHHWTFAGMYLGYRAIMDRWGLSALAPDDLDYQVLPNEFVGSLNRQLGEAISTDDRFSIGLPKEPVPYDLTVNGEALAVDAGYYLAPATSTEPVSYDLYPYRNRGVVVADTHRPGLPDLLIIGDSFKGALEAVMHASFDKTRHLDFRFDTAPSATDYIKEHQPDYVVVVLSGLLYLSPPWNTYQSANTGSDQESAGE